LAIVTGASLALTTVPALAVVSGHKYSTSFAGSGTNAMTTPTSVAVDNSSGPSAGDVYVPDSANARVEKFNAAGTFILMFGKEVNKTAVEESATRSAEENVCPAPGHPADVCQAGTSGSGAGQFTSPNFIAVDGSSGPSAGDVYVANTGGCLCVQKFDPNGNLITAWGGSPAAGQQNGASLTGGPFSPIGGVAVDASGNLWVFKTSPTARVFELAQDGTSITTFTTERGSLQQGFAVDGAGNLFKVNGDASTEKFNGAGSAGDIGQVDKVYAATGLATDFATNDLYVTDGGSSVAHYHFTAINQVVTSLGPTCTFAPFSGGCELTDSFGSGDLSGAKGLAVNKTSDTVYVADTNNHQVDVFTEVRSPDITTAPPSNQEPTSVMVSGTVAPDPAGGGPVTECVFKYGTDTTYSGPGSGSVPCTPDPSSNPPGSYFTGSTDVSAEITGLTTLTRYHFRLFATNSSGTGSGVDQSFEGLPFLPAISGTSASGIGLTGATLNAQVNPGFGPTVYRFQYGTTAFYGSQTLPSASIGEDGIDHAVSTAITGLSPGTTYHFRAVGINFTGVTNGPDQTFKTSSVPLVEGGSTPPVTQPTGPAPPTAPSPDCGKLRRLAKQNSGRAKRLRHKAAQTSDAAKARALRRRAAHFAKKAKQLNSQAVACSASGGGGK
jgi:hypothetical protein